MRQCFWCDRDISADGMAVPIRWSRDDWQCADRDGCFAQQIEAEESVLWRSSCHRSGRRIEDVPVLIDYL